MDTNCAFHAAMELMKIVHDTVGLHDASQLDGLKNGIMLVCPDATADSIHDAIKHDNFVVECHIRAFIGFVNSRNLKIVDGKLYEAEKSKPT